MPTQYRYTPEQCGMTAFPPGELQLEGFDVTTDPAAADVFVVPPMLHHLIDYGNGRARKPERLYELPYLFGVPCRRGRATQNHVLFNVGDTFLFEPHLPAIMLRCDATKRLCEADPTTVPIAWPAPDRGDMGEPDGGFRYDVSFIGWESTPENRTAIRSCQDAGLRCCVGTWPEFYGYTERDNPELAKHREWLFLDALRYSRLTLSVRSIPQGVVRYRFYEALSAGRMPVLVGDGAALPFGDDKAWEQCVLACPEAQLPQIGQAIKGWLSRHDDADILRRGKIGRELWERRLDSGKWPSIMAEIVRERRGL